MTFLLNLYEHGRKRFELRTWTVTLPFAIPSLRLNRWHGLSPIFSRHTRCPRRVTSRESWVTRAQALWARSPCTAQFWSRGVRVRQAETVALPVDWGHLRHVPEGLMLREVWMLQSGVNSVMGSSEATLLPCVAAGWRGSREVGVGDVVRAAVQGQGGLGECRVQGLGWGMRAPKASEQRVIHVSFISTNPLNSVSRKSHSLAPVATVVQAKGRGSGWRWKARPPVILSMQPRCQAEKEGKHTELARGSSGDRQEREREKERERERLSRLGPTGYSASGEVELERGNEGGGAEWRCWRNGCYI